MNSVSIRRAAVLAAILALSLIGAGSAHATVGPAGHGEPPTTRSTTNTWHFAYTPVSTGYQMCFKFYKNGALIKSYPENPNPSLPPAAYANDGMCTGYYFNTSQPGTIPFTEENLEPGARYTVCSFSYENYGDGTWFMRVNSYESCSSTTIDFGKPSLTTWVGGEATYTNNPVIPVHMRYEDALSHPWSQNRGNALAKAATIGCLTRGDSCTPNEYVEGCSQPNGGRYTQTPGHKTNSFDCGYDFTQYEDGRVTFCAQQSDWALADKPSTVDQFSNQTSNAANQSDVACGNVILDRGAPTLDAGADRTVKAGDLVTLSASASDALSGVGQIAWTFGDNTQGSNGTNATHTYTQPGTYVAKATTTDGAGNAGEDTVTITVQPASSTTPGGGGSDIPSKGSATTQTITQTEAKTVILREGGSAVTATVAIAGLDVSAPRSLKARKAGAKLPVVLDAEGAGTVALALVKGAKVVARGGTTLTAAGTFVVRLKLPKQIKSGRYSLRVSFTPKGESKAVTKKLTVKITAPKARARASAVPAV
jgi:hypothetical protein